MDQRSVLAEIMEALPDSGTETLCHSSLYMSSFPFQGAYVVYDKIGNLARLKYVLIAILLFLIGLALMFTFFLMITIPFALAVWAWAGIFLYLAAIGRPYSDFVAALRWQKSRNG